VIRFDLAGYGLTGPAPGDDYPAERDIAMVTAILDKLGVEKCVLGGASLGGGVAWRTALLHASRVEKLILVDAGGYPSKSISMPIGYRLAMLPKIKIDWRVQHILPRYLVAQGIRNVFGGPAKVTDEMIDRTKDLTQREGNRRAVIERFRQSRPGPFSERISKLKQPTLIVWGGKDRLIPPENAHRFHRDIAGSTLSIFEGLGHAPEEEDPVATCRPLRTL
jgi:pimeloyl-ACP methyl ester carboxylesterase